MAKLWIPEQIQNLPMQGTREDDSRNIPLFADARMVNASLRKQLEILESFVEGLEGDHARWLDDALFYLNETIEALDKIG